MTQPATTKRWLSIIGIGEEGIAGLTGEARARIHAAEYVFGASRHLSLAGSLIRGTAREWSKPFDSTFADLLACRGHAVCMLTSGDPFQYGAGSSIAAWVEPEEVFTIPGISAYSLAAARLLWPLQQTTLLSFCGRPVTQLRRYLQPGARILALSANGKTPGEVAELLVTLGFGLSRVHVLESLGGPQERIRTTAALEFSLEDVSSLNTIAIEAVPSSSARILPAAPGIADDWFEHDGQITKREIRAVTLAALAPREREHLWDVGAGSGSVAIEWLLRHGSLSATAFEQRADRAERIGRNARTFGVPELEVLTGAAPDVLATGRAPDAVFIGGGLTVPRVVEAAQDALSRGGRLVANAVSIESEAALIAYQKNSGGTLTRFSVSRVEPIAGSRRFSAWQATPPITQWIWEKTGVRP